MPINNIATARKRPLRILLVEDHADTLLMLQRVLGWEDYEVLAARGVMEGLRLGLAHAPDLLVADLKLPDGYGWQLLARLRQAYPSLVGVVASGFDDPQAVARSEQAGFCLHLTKPINFAKLIDVIAQCDARRDDVDTAGSSCVSVPAGVPPHPRPMAVPADPAWVPRRSADGLRAT